MPSTITDRLDGLTTSVAVKAPCRVATTANITLSGTQTIDGVAVVAGDRVLVKNQTSAVDNGIWVCGAGTWARATDFDGTFDGVGGTRVSVTSGTANANSEWRTDGDGAIVIGTDSITWERATVSEAGYIAFTHATSYAAGTVGAKLKQYIAVKDAPYSAAGDGTDDTAEFQAAIDATPNGTDVTLEIPVPTTSYNIAGTLNAGTRTIQWIEKKGGSTTADKLPGAVLASRKGFNIRLPTGSGGDGWVFEVTKHSSPLSYTANTRAGVVVQIEDAQNMGNNTQYPAAVFDFKYSGQGWVDAANYLSTGIGLGLFSAVTKTGDGSAHAFTVTGELGAIGAGAVGTGTGGYNECGGYQGTITNVGSTRGNISGYEFITADGTSGTNYDTAIKNCIARVARYNAGSRPVHCFMASSEGNQPVDSIITVNTDAYNQFKVGLDFANTTFTVFAGTFPNNTSLAWKGGDGTVRAVVGSSNIGISYLRPSDTAAYVELQKTDGTALLRAESVGVRVPASGVGLGYATGAGGTVAQATNKSTGVTLSKACGQITMDAAALAGDTTVSFVLTNTVIDAGDVLVLNHVSGGTPGSYLLNARAASGSATIDVRNITTGSLSEAIVIGFAVIKAVTA